MRASPASWKERLGEIDEKLPGRSKARGFKPANHRLPCRGADTDRHDLSAGLLAISMGLRDFTPDDHEVLKYGLVIYDGLYAWASH
jgi:hypothetical protein